jgi:hypothetical protein
VAAGVARRIGFGLDNTAADAAIRMVPHQDLADQEPRHLHCAGWQLFPAQQSVPEHRAYNA